MFITTAGHGIKKENRDQPVLGNGVRDNGVGEMLTEFVVEKAPGRAELMSIGILSLTTTLRAGFMTRRSAEKWLPGLQDCKIER